VETLREDPPSDTPVTRIKNLDVLGLDQEPNFGGTKDGADERAQAPLLSSLSACTAQPYQHHKHRRQYRSGGTRYITLPQATNIIEAADFAKLIDLPLVAHLTIHWSLTDANDDPHGTLFAKLREGLNKWLHRGRIAFAAAWCRERQSGGQSDVVHCHLLFHLPVEYRTAARLLEVEAAIGRLVRLHGGAISHEKATNLRVHDNPDGKYLIKGGGPKVWRLFRLRKEHRRLQGIIHGKRCGTTQNIGRSAREQFTARRAVA